jgi:type I restriction enzyme S subunit
MIPQLRFPEFEGEWVEKKLGVITDIKSGYAFSSSKMIRKKSLYQLIKMSNVYQNKLSLERSPSYWSKIDKKTEKFLLKQNDIVLTLTGTVGKQDYGYSVLIPKDDSFLLNQRLVRLRSKENESIAKFVLPILKLSKFKYYFFNEGKGGTGNQSNVGIEDLKNIKLLFPSLTEQTKIATFLTAVDKRISLLQKKRAELEQYKKGVMQKLFSQTIRFKQDDGNDFPDWEEKKLGDLGDTFNGLTGKTKVDFGAGKPYIQYMQIFSSSRIDTTNFGLVNIEGGENQNQAQYGDVFFTTSSETPNEIGTSSVLTERVEEVYLNSFCFGYRPKSLDELVPEFSQFFFRSDKVRKEIVKLAQGSTRYNMSKVEFMRLKFDMPNKGEQEKIADFLLTLDKSIEKTGNQIGDSVLFKQGLLQKMFV